MAKRKISKEDIRPIILEFGQLIREARQSKDMSQAAVAFAAHLHPSYLGLLERGEINPSLHALLEVAKVLDVRLSSLIRKIESRSGK